MGYHCHSNTWCPWIGSEVFKSLLMGAARGIYTAIERMGRSKGGQGGRIVNITSTAGITVSWDVITEVQTSNFLVPRSII